MKHEMQTLLNISEAAFLRHEFAKAEFFLKRVERVGRASGDDALLMAVAIENLGTAQAKQGKHSTAAASYARALKFRKENGLSTGELRSRIRYKLAEAHFYDRNYFRAEQCLKRAWSEDAHRNSNLCQLWRLIVVLGLQNKLDEEQHYRDLFVSLKQQKEQIAKALPQPSEALIELPIPSSSSSSFSSSQVSQLSC